MSLDAFAFTVLTWGLVYGHISEITTADELINFSNEVNGGYNYAGKTVCLSSDLDLSNKPPFTPIGVNNSHYFSGTFNGQGHVISGLRTNDTHQYTGLFGYLLNGRVRDIVLSSDCIFESMHSTNDSYVGSISGVCDSCDIEGVVNMGNVSYSGEGKIFMGGITGGPSIGEDISTIKNCANYGTITNERGTMNHIIIGGITGFLYGNIQNCLNHGMIANKGETSNVVAIGGIIGSGMRCNVHNCLTTGKIINDEASNFNVGTIIGAHDKVYISNCFWTSKVGSYNIFGNIEHNESVVNSLTREQDTALLAELNKITLNDSSYSYWRMLHLNSGKINDIDGGSLIVTLTRFPDPVKEGYFFKFWCTDGNTCNNIYNPKTALNESHLFAGFIPDEFIVSFDFGNGTTTNSTLRYNDNITYPDHPTRDGYEFAGWDSTITTMPPENVTIKALWKEILEIASSTETGYVEIVFGKKDMKKEEIEIIIKEITQENFIIEKIVYDESSGETRIIVRFKDAEVAQNFVETIEGEPEEWNNIKKVYYCGSVPISFAQRSFIFSLSVMSSFL